LVGECELDFNFNKTLILVIGKNRLVARYEELYKRALGHQDKY